ncbi:hypothetical protein PhCBS80983_g04294 [Powellomyces hirtus]|uniref:GPI inositol-deacylase n=1 Tax=Powellomyces hirtus TaxID=109895 RepID=A0A507DYN0_9FUNG|nr:hypothetical protein PhCBS80983_g04294 [Powellomyces hirtus]
MPFDVFTIDTDEELAAFQRDLVKDQASYVNDAIQFILSMYPTLPQYEPPFPSAVIVVAHSMGGLVARTLPTLSNFVAGSVNTIITLATPHVAPPAPLEWRLARHYRDLNGVWSQHLGDGSTAVQDTLGLRSSTLISIAGGTHDTMISSALTEVRTFLPPENGFTVYSTSMPNVWTAADHRAILWCNQVVKSLSRALFEVVDSASPQKTIGRAERLEVFNRELQGTIRSADANDPLWQDPEDTIRLTGEQADGTKSYQLSVPPKSSNLDTFLMMTDSSASDVFACRRNADSNESCTTATKRTEYRIPGRVKSKPLRLVVLHRGDLGNCVTILIPAKLGHDEFLSAEMINEADSVLEILSSQFGNLDVSVPLNAALTTFRIPSITNGPLKYTVQWSQHCKEPTQALFPPILHQSFRSTSEAKFLTDPTQSLITSYGHPKSAPWIQSDGLELRVLADPACGPLHLTLRIDWVSSLGALDMKIQVAAFPGLQSS